LLRESWLEKASKTLPAILRYATHVKNNSLYNTPPCFAVYMVNLVLQWLDKQGGLPAIADLNARKAKLLYDTIDGSNGFYRGHAVPSSRSRMNVTFRLSSETLEKKFIADAQAAGMIGLAGHRSVGGIRASIYNAVPLAACQTLATFMMDFARSAG
jgi:phosphoserine aminotransferase